MVADAHLEQCLGHTAVARRGGSQHLAFVDHLLDGLVNGDQAADLGQTVLVVGAQDDNGAVGLLELGALHVVGVADGRRKADERRGHVQPLKAAGHRVLAADGRNAQTHLGIQRTEQGGQRLAQRSAYRSNAQNIPGTSGTCPRGGSPRRPAWSRSRPRPYTRRGRGQPRSGRG